MRRCSMLMDWKNTVKMSILPKAICTFNANPTKIPVTFLTEIEQTILKCARNHKRPEKPKKFRENKAGGMMLSDFILYYKVGGGGSLVAQLCPTLCNPMDWSPPGSSVHGILQTRILEWAAISLSVLQSYSSQNSRILA